MPCMIETVRITDADGEILRFLAETERECFSAPLSAEQIGRLLRDENACWLLARLGQEPAGYVWVQTVLDEGYIGNVAVHPQFRRRGVGDCLLEKLDALAAEKKLSFLTLEVRAGNEPAKALYRKHGYREAGCRPGYYSGPREDAVLMTKEYA